MARELDSRSRDQLLDEARKAHEEAEHFRRVALDTLLVRTLQSRATELDEPAWRLTELAAKTKKSEKGAEGDG